MSDEIGVVSDIIWCLFGKEHTWMPTGNERSISWITNSYDPTPPPDAPVEREEWCPKCGETRWTRWT